MKAIVTYANPDGTFDTVGTNNRMVISGLKTERGIIRRARRASAGRIYRIELFRDAQHFYRDPFKVITRRLHF